MSVEPMPEGWNKTFADLDAEVSAGLRTGYGSPESDWAREYEISQFPANTRWPRNGDIVEALEDITVTFIIFCASPVSSGGSVLVKRGERLLIQTHPTDLTPISVYARPLTRAVEWRIAPGRKQKLLKHGVCVLGLDTKTLIASFSNVGVQAPNHSLQARRP